MLWRWVWLPFVTGRSSDVSGRHPKDSKLSDPASGKEIRLTSYAACAG
jgi:hypothetical protein